MNLRRRSPTDDRFLIEIPESSLTDIQETSYVSGTDSDAEAPTASDARTPSSIPAKDMSSSSANSMSFLRSPSQSNLNSSSTSKANVRRWSQSLNKGSKGRKSFRQRTIHFMPSRMLKPLSIEGQLLGTIMDESEIDYLVTEIEQHEHLMEDNAFGEQLRTDILRALPQSMSIKREIKSKVDRTITNKTKELGATRWTRIKFSTGLWYNQTKIFSRNTMIDIELWYKSMKEIEGHFGGGVGTYFKFLRYLFILDLILMVLSVGFIVVPQILFNSFTEDTVKYFEIHSDSNETVLTNATRDTFSFLDLFTAEGYLENSILFYGNYTNKVLGQTSGHSYSIPYAYFLTMVILYICTFITISMSMAWSYRKSFIETSGGVTMYAHRVFCSWDYSISNKKAAEVKQCSIFKELKTTLDEIYQQEEHRTKLQQFWTIATQVSAHVLVFSILGALAYVIWSTLHVIAEGKISPSPYSALYVPFIVVLTMLGLQSIFAWLANLEDYKSPRVTLHVTLLRNYALEVVIVAVLLCFWLDRSTKRKEHCWETAIGQEIYRLVIVDFLIVCIGGAVIHALRFCVFKYVWPGVGLPEFNISRGSLGLIFNQTLLWIGLFFSPALAAIVVSKMLFIFYIKKIVLINFCRPPSKLWRSAQTSTLFLVLTFVSLVGVVVALAYILTQVEVSPKCGPFRTHSLMFHVFLGDILKLKQEHFFWRLIMFLIRPAVIGGLLLTLCVMVYYLRSKSRARIAMVKLLKEMLYLEAKDKEFLLTNITRVTQGKDWILDESFINARMRRSRFYRQPADNNHAESSKTWNYRNKETPIHENGNGKPANGNGNNHEASATSSTETDNNKTTGSDGERNLRNRRIS